MWFLPVSRVKERTHHTAGKTSRSLSMENKQTGLYTYLLGIKTPICCWSFCWKPPFGHALGRSFNDVQYNSQQGLFAAEIHIFRTPLFKNPSFQILSNSHKLKTISFSFKNHTELPISNSFTSICTAQKSLEQCEASEASRRGFSN